MSLGLGVMIQQLFGSNGAEHVQAAIGKKIESVELYDDERLCFKFADGSTLSLFDDGQSCCESRYMRTDDDLSYYVGAEFQNVEIKDGPDQEDDEYGEAHECQFLVITTDKGQFTMSNHVEHNGYYGGFAICASK
jgi:hypothetical protein